MYPEINPGALFDKKGHSSSIQTVKGFYTVLGAMIKQHIKKLYNEKRKHRKVKNYFLICIEVKRPHNRGWQKN